MWMQPSIPFGKQISEKPLRPPAKGLRLCRCGGPGWPWFQDCSQLDRLPSTPPTPLAHHLCGLLKTADQLKNLQLPVAQEPLPVRIFDFGLGCGGFCTPYCSRPAFA